MKNVKSYSDFIIESVSDHTEMLNESIFEKMKGAIAKISMLFKNTEALNKQVDSAETKAGTSNDNLTAKSVKIGSTKLIKLVDPLDETKKSILSLTKLADLPDSSGLFQITGSDNEQFLTSLGAEDVVKLNIQGVLAIVNPEGFQTGKNLTMYIYKNQSKEGKPVITEAVIKAALPAEIVAKEPTK